MVSKCPCQVKYYDRVGKTLYPWLRLGLALPQRKYNLFVDNIQDPTGKNPQIGQTRHGQEMDGIKRVYTS